MGLKCGQTEINEYSGISGICTSWELFIHQVVKVGASIHEYKKYIQRQDIMMVSFPKREQLSPFYFFQLGFWSNTPVIVVIWIAIDDILAGTLWSTPVLLIAVSIPDILAKAFSPAVISRISFHLSFTLLTILLVVSILLLVIIDDVRVRIAGVTVLGLANGFTIITCVRMLVYYDTAELLANAYQNGRQCSIFLTSIGYTG